MTGRERTRAIIHRKSADRVGFWLGNPSDDAKFSYYKHLGIHCEVADTWESTDHLYTTYVGPEDIQMSVLLSSDILWASPDMDPGAYRHPEGKPMFDVRGGKALEALASAGVFAETEDVAEVERFDWPNPDYMDFTATEALIDQSIAANLSVFGGMWCPFFHIASDFFGMEEYFIKMHTNPKVVDAVTEPIVDFLLACNEKMYASFGDKMDSIFFGNDLGTQLSTLIGIEQFKRFILPYIKKIIDQAKRYDQKVAFHSCGAVAPLIPLLIDAGVDILHPLQAKAVGMDAETLAREYKNDLIFMGGVDTQDLLPFGTPEQVKAEVRRLKDLFGAGFIVSPSHEAILPHVPLENVLAMRDAAIE